jgi:hypothetical protein
MTTQITTTDQVVALKKGAKVTRTIQMNGYELITTLTVTSNRKGDTKLVIDDGTVVHGIRFNSSHVKWFAN